jgi:hypothetical protein
MLFGEPPGLSRRDKPVADYFQHRRRFIMSVGLHEEAGGKILHVQLSGKLATEDYQQFVPEFERLVQREGKIRVLVRMHNFHGWTMGALWEDIKFDLKHFGDIERLALVGERKWEAGMAAFCKPFTRATIRYFDEAQAEEANRWIKEGLPQTV